jgi:hypothetical protein
MTERRVSAPGVLYARMARDLAAPHLKSIDHWQSRLAYMAAVLSSSHADRLRIAALRQEAQSIDAEVHGEILSLNAAIWRAPAPVGLHSRVGDVRNALLSIQAKAARMREAATM